VQKVATNPTQNCATVVGFGLVSSAPHRNFFPAHDVFPTHKTTTKTMTTMIMMVIIIIIIIKSIVPSGTYVVYEFLPFSPVFGNSSQLPRLLFPASVNVLLSQLFLLAFLSFWSLVCSALELGSRSFFRNVCVASPPKFAPLASILTFSLLVSFQRFSLDRL
jgi:hypothetical protein